MVVISFKSVANEGVEANSPDIKNERVEKERSDSDLPTNLFLNSKGVRYEAIQWGEGFRVGAKRRVHCGS